MTCKGRDPVADGANLTLNKRKVDGLDVALVSNSAEVGLEFENLSLGLHNVLLHILVIVIMTVGVGCDKARVVVELELIYAGSSSAAGDASEEGGVHILVVTYEDFCDFNQKLKFIYVNLIKVSNVFSYL